MNKQEVAANRNTQFNKNKHRWEKRNQQ